MASSPGILGYPCLILIESSILLEKCIWEEIIFSCKLQISGNFVMILKLLLQRIIWSGKLRKCPWIEVSEENCLYTKMKEIHRPLLWSAINQEKALQKIHLLKQNVHFYYIMKENRFWSNRSENNNWNL